MTTESQPLSRAGGITLGAAAAAVVLGGLVVLIGAVTSGRPAALGALVGLAMSLGTLVVGTLSVDLVARVLPGASMVVALLTYALQVLSLALVFAALTGSGLLETTLDRHWLGAAVITVALTWTVAQIRLFTRARIPVYDLAPHPTGEPVDAGAR